MKKTSSGLLGLALVLAVVAGASAGASAGGGGGGGGDGAVPPNDGYKADFDGNGVVDSRDIGYFMNSYGKTSTDAGFNVAFDFNHDGVINSLDYSILMQYVQHWNYYHLDKALLQSGGYYDAWPPRTRLGEL